jgi:AraC-like DNA-binding protein
MDEALDRLLPSRRRPALDPRVKRITERLRQDPAADVSLEALASQAGLSPSRFLHLFKASVGVPLRPYVRWLRVQRAAAHIVRGAALSEAAVEAGFSDAAHMSRTFRATFGMTPSDLRPPRP